jgi:hypothetical protein
MKGALAQAAGIIASILKNVSYEKEAEAAMRPVPKGYRRREPEKTALHKVVRDNLETLLDQARQKNDDGVGYPVFVEKEFRRYLDCGILANGFSRLRCQVCSDEAMVAFSCKGRICPSCWARRSSDTAAHLVDRVLPKAAYRQWVLTFPWNIRFLLATDGAFLSAMLRTFVRTVFSWLRLQARRRGIKGGEPGAITLVQRFGGILNVNPHFHVVVSDGVFIQGPDGQAEFKRLPPPTDDDIRDLTRKLAVRLGAIARRRIAEADGEDPFQGDPEKALVQSTIAEAMKVPKTPSDNQSDGHDDEEEKKRLCARVDGFSLHAAREIAPNDRQGLEQLCRYGLRAPFSLDRISIDPDGMVRYRLLRPWPKKTGKTFITLDPLVFLRRLAALVPGPYLNLVRYHGVFANRSRMRALLPIPPESEASKESTHESTCDKDHSSAEDDTHDEGRTVRKRRLPWAQLLKRVLNVDALTCRKCKGRMDVLAFITDPDVVQKILKHLGLPFKPPKIAPARRPVDEECQQQELFANQSIDAHRMEDYLDVPPSRGPP